MQAFSWLLTDLYPTEPDMEVVLWDEVVGMA